MKQKTQITVLKEAIPLLKNILALERERYQIFLTKGRKPKDYTLLEDTINALELKENVSGRR